MKRKGMLLFLTLCLLLPLWAEGGTEKAAGKPREFRVAVATLPTTLDSPRLASNTCGRISFNVFDALIFADPVDGYKLKPMLAESWKRIDANTLELKLRKGVKFHSGDEFTSEDVKFSLERSLDPKNGFVLARSALATIDKIETPDPLTVRIITKQPDPLLEFRISTNVWGAEILSKRYTSSMSMDDFGFKAVGTGPYRLVELSPAQVVLERFDGFWGLKPEAERIVFRYIPEPAAMITAIVNKEVDIVTQIPPDQVDVLAKDKNLDVKNVLINNIHVVYYNTSYGPLKDKRIRQAMNLAIDRQLLVDTLWSGRNEVPRGHQYAAYGDLYMNDYPKPEYNPEKAKRLVQESGYKGELITYETRPTYYTNGQPAGEAVVDMWKKVGLNAKIKISEDPSSEQVRNWSNSMRFPDPLGGLWLLWGAESERQKGRLKTWFDPPALFNELGKQMEKTMDRAARGKINAEMMKIWDDEAPGTVYYYPYETYGMRKGITWTPYATLAMSFRAGNFSFGK
jgi:peptide/nickel transport system substrate-binding protein